MEGNDQKWEAVPATDPELRAVRKQIAEYLATQGFECLGPAIGPVDGDPDSALGYDPDYGIPTGDWGLVLIQATIHGEQLVGMYRARKVESHGRV